MNLFLRWLIDFDLASFLLGGLLYAALVWVRDTLGREIRAWRKRRK